MPFYVGVDQALRKIGVCILQGEGQGDGEVDLKLILPPTDLRGPARLQYLRDALWNYLSPCKDKIVKCAMEAQSLGSMGDIDQLGHINGVVQVLLSDLGTTPLVVAPALLKKFVTGQGQATKQAMMTATYRVWGVKLTQDDLCDAHGLARIAKEYTENTSTIRAQIEVVHRLTHHRKKTRIKRLFPNAL